jgi:OmcA/MtrC family decaheme c-type cytochrome
MKFAGARGITRSRVPLIAMLALAATIGLAGCEGDDGSDGATGPAGPGGPAGPTGPSGPAGPTGPTGTPPPTAGDSAGLLRGGVTKITITSGAVAVEFEIKDKLGNPVTLANPSELEFGIAKLMPRTDLRPMYWQSLVQYSTGSDSATSAKVLRPSTERGSTNAALTNRGDVLPVSGKAGTYTYTFCTNIVDVGTFKYFGNTGAPSAAACGVNAGAGAITTPAGTAILGAMNLSFDPAATYRLYVGSRNSAFKYNAVTDFQGGTPGTPLATFANQVVTNASCGGCHGDSENRSSLRFRNLESADATANIHGGNRFEVESCTVCHNSSWFDSGESRADVWKTELDLPQLVHKLHIGNEEFFEGRYADLHFYPQDITNCRTCHDNQQPLLASAQPAGRTAAEKMAWTDRPSQQACNTCHDVNFQGGHFIVQNDNSRCLDCHDPASSVYAATAHITTPNISTPNSPELLPGYKKLQYEIASVTVNATNQPIVKFRVQYQDRSATTGLPDGTWKNLDVKAGQFADGTPFTGGPSFRITWSNAQPTPVNPANGPAVATPVDYNNAGVTVGGRTYFGAGGDFTASYGRAAFDQPPSVTLASILASLPAMDSQGFFTTPALSIAYPAGATLRAVAMEGGFVFGPPLPGATAAPNNVAKAAIRSVDGSTTARRRDVTNDDACLLCHERLILHGGSRVDNPDQCVICHNTEMTSSNTFAGWIKPTPGSANGKPWLVATAGEATAFQVFGEKTMNLKDMLHLLHGQGFNSEVFNFLRSNPNATTGGANAYEFQEVRYPGRLDDCKTCHTATGYRLPLNASALWTVYEAFPGLSATTTAPSFPGSMTRTAPTSAACGTCHDDSSDKAHFAINTSIALGAESCDVCHGPGRSADVEAAHGARNQ